MIGILKTKHKPVLYALLLLIIIALTPLAVYAAINNPLVIEVEQSFTSSATVDGSFKYILVPNVAGNPMPAGSGAAGFTFQIDGTGKKLLDPINYSEQGVYVYRIYQLVETAEEYYTYDRRVFEIEVHVSEALNVSNIVYEIVDNTRSENKAPKIEFANRYYKAGPGDQPKDDPPERDRTIVTDKPGYNPPPTIIVDEKVPTAGEPPVDVPKTGDDTNMVLYYLFFALGAVAALAAMIYLYTEIRRKKDFS